MSDEIDYDRYNKILQLMLDGMWRDPDDLEIGRDISDLPEVKIIFDGYGDLETDRKSTRLNSSHVSESRMPSSA